MRIERVWANRSSFRPVEFNRHFNIVVADRTTESARTDSRNGLGKSTLVEIVHFCLGGNLSKDSNLGRLRNVDDSWEFSLDLNINGEEITVQRELGRSNEVSVLGAEDLGIPAKYALDSVPRVKLADWRAYLGVESFGLDFAADKYSPTFRLLFPFFARSGRGAFLTPFETTTRQKAWQTQVSNAFLLRLNWRIAAEWQTLKDETTTLKSVGDFSSRKLLRAAGNLGELESERIRLRSQVDELRRAVNEFRVLPQYEDRQRQLDEITSEIKSTLARVTLNERMLDLYLQRIQEEPTVAMQRVIDLYNEVGIAIPVATRRSIEDVHNFHANVTQNRQDYLAGEIARLRREIEADRSRVEDMERQRAEGLALLQTGGALSDLTELQSRLAEQTGRLALMEERLEILRGIRAGQEGLKLERQSLKQRALIDYYERRAQWTSAVEHFAQTTRFLYGESGDLIIEVTDSGYSFRTRLEREGSHGVGNMRIFAYDLALMALWSSYPGVGMLIHDSGLYEGVDERQVARALRLASTQSGELDSQYIALINSDNLPREELESLDVNVDEAMVLRLMDSDPSGSLLGFRF